jgi:hypothetical protein
MRIAKRIIFLLFLFHFYSGGEAFSQLWRYLDNFGPAREEAHDKALAKDAISVVTKYDTSTGDSDAYTVRTYQLEALDGGKCKVQLYYIPFSKEFSIDYGKESLKIEEFMGLSQVHVLNKNLLQINYSVRGGSNQGYQHILILAIIKGKPQIVLNIQSVDEFGYGEMYGLYTVDLKHLMINKENQQIFLSTREEYSDIDWSKSYINYNRFYLVFSKAEYIFFNQFRTLKGKYKLGEFASDKFNEVELNGEFKIIHLDQADYYYINKRWYNRGRGDVINSFYPFSNL